MNTTTTPMTFKDCTQLLHRALCALAGVCDGARDEDGRGFNSRDTRWGKQMAASNPGTWSPKAAFLVARMLRIYTKQMAGMGIDMSVLPAWNAQTDAEEMRNVEAAPVQREPIRGTEPVQVRVARRITKKPDDFFCVEFPYEARLVELIKTLPYKSRQWNGVNRNWLVKPALCASRDERERAAKDLMRIGRENAFEFGDGVEDALFVLIGVAAKEREGEKAALEASFAVDACEDVEGLGLPLFGYQKAGVAYGRAKKCVLIGDEMGLGKTPQAIAIVHAENAFPCVIVCRASLQENWIREIRRWVPGRTLATVPNTKADFTILTHHALTTHAESICRYTKVRALVIDESQDVKNSKAKRTKAALQIVRECKPEYRFLLTGTAVENRPFEFVSQLQILGMLDALGGWKHFTRHYCNAHNNGFGMDFSGSANLEELNRELRSRCYLRRLKKDVLKDLPDKIRTVINVEITNRPEYVAAEKQVLARLANLEREAMQECKDAQAKLPGMDILTLIEFVKVEFPKVAIGTLLEWQEQGDAEEVRAFVHASLSRRVDNVANAKALMILTELKRVCALGKLEAIKEHVATLGDGGQKSITFAHHRDVQQTLARTLPSAIWTRAPRYSTSQAAVDEFQTRADVLNIVCSLKGDNAGLNMTAASHVNFAELDWTPAKHDQAEDRAHRIGQKSCVNAYYFIGINTVDEVIWKCLEDKRAITKQCVDGTAPEAGGGSILPELLRVLRSRN